jgi:hypothetical protein
LTFELVGTPPQNAVAGGALARCTFPFDVLTIDRIPVEWADLSRYTATVAEGKASGGHAHVHEGGDTGHPIEVRERVLGLAWYSGRVTLDASLEHDPTLAGEVLLSEAAHMADFYWMTDRHRMVIWNALHPEAEDLPLDTNVEDGVPLGGGEGWFDVGDYRSWLGEQWMGLFVRAYSDFPVTIPFDRPPTDEAVAQVRAAFTPYFRTSTRSGVYHDTHAGLPVAARYADPPTALRSCGVCKPVRRPL